AGDLDARPHGRVELLDGGGVDQLHGAFAAAVPGQERVVAVADDVDKGVADGDDVMVRHVRSLLVPRTIGTGRRSRSIPTVAAAAVPLPVGPYPRAAYPQLTLAAQIGASPTESPPHT